MNLNAIVGGCIATINPWVIASYSASTGYTTSADGTRVPTYAATVPVQVQKQPLVSNDLRQLDGLNLNGEKCAFYVNDNWQGISRPTGKGGDLISLPDGSNWLIVMQLENWYGTASWGKVAAVLQQ